MTTQASKQFLTFSLGGEVYALEVNRTREVVDFANITPIPKTPEWIRGVLNLRGNVIPVLDLKLRLGMGMTERTKVACILILELEIDGEAMVMGVLADSVQEVLEVDTAQIEPPPRFGAKVSTTYIRGMGRRAEGLFIILDIDRVFSNREVELAADCVNQAAGETGPEASELEPKDIDASARKAREPANLEA